MTLSEERMTEQQKRNELDMLNGNICRICITDDLQELLNQFGFAVDRIQRLVVNTRNRLFENRFSKRELRDYIQDTIDFVVEEDFIPAVTDPQWELKQKDLLERLKKIKKEIEYDLC